MKALRKMNAYHPKTLFSPTRGVSDEDIKQPQASGNPNQSLQHAPTEVLTPMSSQ